MSFFPLYLDILIYCFQKFQQVSYNFHRLVYWKCFIMNICENTLKIKDRTNISIVLRMSLAIFGGQCSPKMRFSFFKTSLPRYLRPTRSLRGHTWFLTGVNGVFHARNVVYRSPGSSVSILKSLASLEVPRLLGVSRASSKESKRTSLVPDQSQW